MNDTVERRARTLGTEHLNRRDLEVLRDAGRQIELRVLGLATVADDVSPEELGVRVRASCALGSCILCSDSGERIVSDRHDAGGRRCSAA